MGEKRQVCDRYCLECVYYHGTTCTCNYIFIEDRRRECPPGTGCDKRVTRSERRKLVNISLKPVKARKPQNEVRKHAGKPIGVKITAEENIRRLDLYKSGLSDREIGCRVGVSRGSITKWRLHRNLPANFDSSHRRRDAAKNETI